MNPTLQVHHKQICCLRLSNKRPKPTTTVCRKIRKRPGGDKKKYPGFLQHQRNWQGKFMSSIPLKILLRKLWFPSSHHKILPARREITILPGVCLLFSVGFSEGDTWTPWWELLRPGGADPLESKSLTNSLLQLNFVCAHHWRSSGCFCLPSAEHLSKKPHEML